MESRYFAVSGGNEVFESRDGALAQWKQLSKTDKKARFKGFATSEEATAFATAEADVVDGASGETTTTTTTTTATTTPDSDPGGCTFPKLKVPALNAFRIAMERDEDVKVKSLVEENTRYLIECSADLPVLLHKGCHYNALHVCARKDRPAMARYVLDTISSAEFWRRTYPLDSEQVMEQRRDHLLDLYLHARDKGKGYTSIHFASDLGHHRTLEVLLSHAKADANVLTRDGRSVAEVVCEHGPQDETERERARLAVLELLEGQFYVPILRPEDDDSSPAVLGQPFSPSQGGSPLRSAEMATTPVSEQRHPPSPLRVNGVAGPMSPSRAHEFYASLKRPRARSERLSHSAVLRSDWDRGLERLGRDLARRYGVNWQERWSFLEMRCDLSSQDGLQKLEEFFATREKELGGPVRALTPVTPTGRHGPGEVAFTTPTHSSRPSVFNPATPDATDSAFDDMMSSLENATLEDNVTPPGDACDSPILESPASAMANLGSVRASEGSALLYIFGVEPSKHDQDVLLAIGDAAINAVQFPRVADWYQRTQCFSSTERSKWRTPKKLRMPSRHHDASPLASPIGGGTGLCSPRHSATAGSAVNRSMHLATGTVGSSPRLLAMASPGDNSRSISLQERSAMNRTTSPRRLDADFANMKND